MKKILVISSAMSDASRLRVLCALRNGELCACDIMEMLGLAQATVSRHMGILVQAGLVIGTKKGRWMYYHLPAEKGDTVPEALDAIKWVHSYAMTSPQAAEDAIAIKEHRKKHGKDCTK